MNKKLCPECTISILCPVCNTMITDEEDWDYGEEMCVKCAENKSNKQNDA
jgi:hypothetical protein